MFKMFKKVDNNLSKVIKNPFVKYLSILMLLLSTMYIKSFNTDSLKKINNEYMLVVLGLVIVYLIYVDIALALVLTLFLVVCIQEYNTRLSVMHIKNTKNDEIDTNMDNTNLNEAPETDILQNYSEYNRNGSVNNNNVDISMNASDNIATEFKKQVRLVPSSSYGDIKEKPFNMSNNLKYENQIGNINISNNDDNIYSKVDDIYQDFADFTQNSINNTPNLNNNQPNEDLANVLINEGFNNMDKAIEEEQYDHPASKTLTEMSRVKKVDYINDNNLEVIQSNTSGLKNIPCAVESICASMNAQSF